MPIIGNLQGIPTLKVFCGPPSKKDESFFSKKGTRKKKKTSPEVTQPVPALDPTQLLSFNCFVLGDDLKVFTVEVEVIIL